jgi:hypothetical protein
MKQNVDLKLPIGGKFYVSVTSGFMCVDLREFYYHPINGVKATKRGIALRVTEWIMLKDVMRQLLVKYPILTTTTPCMYEPDHQNQEGAQACLECHPFQFEERYFSFLM